MAFGKLPAPELKASLIKKGIVRSIFRRFINFFRPPKTKVILVRGSVWLGKHSPISHPIEVKSEMTAIEARQLAQELFWLADSIERWELGILEDDEPVRWLLPQHK